MEFQLIIKFERSRNGRARNRVFNFGIRVQAASEDLKLPYLDLFNCVLIHELGRWFNQLAPVFHTEEKSGLNGLRTLANLTNNT